MVGVIEDVLGDAVLAIYVYGSAVAGGLRPASDLDLFAVVDRETTHDERRNLVELLRPISRRGERPSDWRPVELTLVVASDINPWRYPPRTDFQYGEWLHARFDSGEFAPEKQHNPDLVLLLAMVRGNSQPLKGSPPADLLPEVPLDDLRSALIGVVPDLMADVESDTANVLLTLARIWRTLATGEFVSKDAAADWAITRLDSDDARRPLAKARDVYRGTADDRWERDLARAGATAADLESRIRQYAER